MCKKFLLIVAIGILLSPIAQATTIVWVAEAITNTATGANYDQGWVDILKAQGYTVDVQLGTWTTLSDAQIATLNKADLVVFSRTTNSGGYATDATEVTQWNSVTAPMILMGAYQARNSRWLWINSAAIIELANAPATPMKVAKTDHAIFTDVPVVNGQVSIIDETVDLGQMSFIVATDPGNGTILGTRSSDGNIWIEEWAAGKPFYSGSTQTPAGKRMLLTGGGGSGQTMGSMNFNPTGQKIFLNAVLYMMGRSLVAGAALNPAPASQKTDVPHDVDLSWTAGQNAATHDVYLGTSFADVNAASGANAKNVQVSKGQSATTFDPGILQFGRTYYWRVDEVEQNGTVHRGGIWSFTVEPQFYKVTGITATASSYTPADGPEQTINGSGLDANDLASSLSTTMWLTARTSSLPAWIQYDLGRVRKVETMTVWNYNGTFEEMIGIGAQDVTVEYSTNGIDWVQLSGVPQFTWGPGVDGYAADTTVNFGGVAARFVKLTITANWGGTGQTGLSEVRFMEMIDYARTPAPDTGVTNVSPSVTLSWRSGREAVSHQVYVGTDPNVLTLVGTAATNSFAPTTLGLGTKYYWRVDEVNTAATPSTWAGDVWSFTTPASIAVDDMESYNDTTNKLYEVWIDGYNTGTNGAVVGYNDSGTTGTFGDTVTFHGGKQSMPYAYGTGGVTLSEATRTFATSQDWSLHGVKTLVLYFYGSPTNTASQMYVKINSTKVNYTGDAGNISRRRWNQWNIDLASVAGGVKAVKSLTIGLTGSGKGSLFFDDILLYKDAPAVATPVDPGTTGLVGYYAFNSNVNDSSSAGNNGTVVGTPTYVAGLSATNMAIKLNGTTDCVDLGKKAAFNPTGSFSVSLWANIGAWGTAWGHVMVSNRGETDAGGWQIRRGNSTGLCWTTRGIGGTDDLTGATPAQNEWVHVTCVFDQAAATKTLYINGLQSITGTTNANATITATTVDTYIGARATADNTSRDTFFTGMLDEVRIFNRALTDGEADFLSKP